MTEVSLHVYDVTNSGSDKTNNTIMQINKIFKDGIRLGGIFHSAVQVYGDEEWSFGYCEQGTGVFHCPSTKNPMYTYRESIELGKTAHSISKVNQILRELSREWPGESYDLLGKNCNHFCDDFCERLGVAKLPGWVNRFANAGDAAIEIAGSTADRFRQAKTEIVTASRVAYRFLAGIASNASPDSLATLTAELLDSNPPGSRTYLWLVPNHLLVRDWKTRIKTSHINNRDKTGTPWYVILCRLQIPYEPLLDNQGICQLL